MCRLNEEPVIDFKDPRSPDLPRLRDAQGNPTAFMKPWTAEIPLGKSDGLMYEFSRHEVLNEAGNPEKQSV